MRAREWDRVFDALAAATGLTRSQSTFDLRDVVQALCERLSAGAPLDARALEAAAERILASGRAVALLPDKAAFRRRDGRLLPLARAELRNSTAELLAREQRMLERAASSAGAGVGAADVGSVGEAIRRRPTLSDEQRRMVQRLCLDGDRIAVVAGKAGTGKTYALGAAREAWQAAGHPVLGVAVARRAARELETGAGIASTSTVALLGALARGARPLPPASVLVVDEAAMVPTRQLVDLLDHVEDAGGKLVLVGDDRQLPKLDAGGAFRALVRRGLAIELTENQRQVERWERTALDHIRDGRADTALELYIAHGRVRIGDTGEQTRAELVAEWWAARKQPEDAVMIAYRRADVADLNARARDRMRTAGALTGPELELPGGRFAAGDLVVIKRNALGVDVHNGDRGRIITVDPGRQLMLLDCDGRRVELGGEFLEYRTDRGDPTLAHGYAITCHVAQGLTVDRALVLADHGLSRESGYTALSRGRHANYVYTTRQPDDPAPRSPLPGRRPVTRSNAADRRPVDQHRHHARHRRRTRATARRRPLPPPRRRRGPRSTRTPPLNPRTRPPAHTSPPTRTRRRASVRASPTT